MVISPTTASAALGHGDHGPIHLGATATGKPTRPAAGTAVTPTAAAPGTGAGAGRGLRLAACPGRRAVDTGGRTR